MVKKLMNCCIQNMLNAKNFKALKKEIIKNDLLFIYSLISIEIGQWSDPNTSL